MIPTVEPVVLWTISTRTVSWSANITIEAALEFTGSICQLPAHRLSAAES